MREQKCDSFTQVRQSLSPTINLSPAISCLGENPGLAPACPSFGNNADKALGIMLYAHTNHVPSQSSKQKSDEHHCQQQTCPLQINKTEKLRSCVKEATW